MKSSELINEINTRVRGTTAVSIVTETPVRMVKKHRETKLPNPYIGAIKVQVKNGLIGFDYENSVNYQAVREEKQERETKQRAWGTLSDNRIWVLHKGNHYLQLKLQSVGETHYYLDGEEIPAEEIKPYLSGSNKSSTQEDLEKVIIVNDIKIENIKAITMFGKQVKIQ